MENFKLKKSRLVNYDLSTIDVFTDESEDTLLEYCRGTKEEVLMPYVEAYFTGCIGHKSSFETILFSLSWMLAVACNEREIKEEEAG